MIFRQFQVILSDSKNTHKTYITDTTYRTHVTYITHITYVTHIVKLIFLKPIEIQQNIFYMTTKYYRKNKEKLQK